MVVSWIVGSLYVVPAGHCDCFRYFCNTIAYERQESSRIALQPSQGDVAVSPSKDIRKWHLHDLGHIMERLGYDDRATQFLSEEWIIS